ncbi:MAG: undecaprenyl-diphosphatase UppP [Chloroflexota bacterium]|jgi:undecaprenyl-diphosphatase
MPDVTGLTDLLLALALGMVQGLTEFFPISSSAHLYAIPYLFSFSDPLLASRAFGAVLHLGTLAAVLVALRGDVTRLLGCALAPIISRGRRRGDPADERLIIAIIVGTIPAVLVGLIAGDFLDANVRTPLVVAIAVLAGAALLWFADRAQSLQRPLTGVAALDGVVIGLTQALALIPGISRSGATISAGLLLGFSRDAAARISFLMGIPAIAGAGLLELRVLLEGGGDLQHELPLLLVGLLASFLSGLIAIRLLIRLLSGGKLWSFAIYRVGFAALLVVVALVRGQL